MTLNLAPDQADGHCLYRAVEEQLGSGGREELLPAPHDYWAVRAKAAAYMRAHPDQFVPFISQVAATSCATSCTLT